MALTSNPARAAGTVSLILGIEGGQDMEVLILIVGAPAHLFCLLTDIRIGEIVLEKRALSNTALFCCYLTLKFKRLLSACNK